MTMKDINLRMEGIYDLRTILHLKNLNINCFSFDFRPRSFNFLQQYKFFEILQEEYSKELCFFLRYENEKDFVIQKMLTDLKDFFFKNNLSIKNNNNLSNTSLIVDDHKDIYDNNDDPSKSNFEIDLFGDAFPLEFSDDLGRKYYDYFKHPYWWHYRESNELNSLLESPYLKGIVIDSDMFGQYFNQEAILGFLQIFHIRGGEKQEQKKSLPPLKLILRSQWQNNSTLLSIFKNDYIKMEYLSLPIDQSIEICYRNVDLNKLNQNIQNIFSHHK